MGAAKLCRWEERKRSSGAINWHSAVDFDTMSVLTAKKESK